MAADPVRKATPSVAQSFNQQVPVSRDVFKLVLSNSTTTSATNDNTSNKSTNKQWGGGGAYGAAAIVAAPNKPMTDNGILNSVENFQAIQKAIEDPNQQHRQEEQRVQEENSVLAQPLNLMAAKVSSSTSTTTTTESSRNAGSSSNNRKDGKLAGQPPILQSPTAKNSSPTSKKLPEGVVPYPKTSLLENNAPVIDEPVDSNAKEDVKNNLLIDTEQENLAHEVPDEFNIDQDKKGPADIENNAQEDTNQYLNENRGMFGKGEQLGAANQKLNDEKQLKDEVLEDLGKEADNYGDLRLDGQMEEDGDIGEYDDVKAMKVQGPAERN